MFEEQLWSSTEEDRKKQAKLEAELKSEVAKLVVKYAEARLNPDVMAAVIITAHTKIQFAYCQAMLESKKKFGDAGEEATDGFAS